MKKIKLFIHSDSNGRFYLPLEHRERINFKTKRQGNEFLVIYKKHLNNSINSLLYNYSRSHSVFLDYYLQFDSLNSNQLNIINRQILKKIDFIYKDFGEGWSSLLFENLEAAYFLIHQFIEHLKKYAQKFKIQNLIHQLNSILYSYWNDFNAHRDAQSKIFQNIEYRKSNLLKIVFNKNKSA